MPAIVGEYSQDDLLLDRATGLYEIGDISGAGNGTKLSVSDANARIDAISLADSVLILDRNNGLYSIGNGLKAELDDDTGIAKIKAGSDSGLEIDFDNFIYEIGDIGNNADGHKLSIDDLNGLVEISRSGGAFRFLSLDDNNQIYGIGDLDSGGGGIRFIMNDIDQTADLFATEGLTITGDTLLLRTGTTLTDNAGAEIGTLTNAPAAGNPSKWITIRDNGQDRFIPTWAVIL